MCQGAGATAVYRAESDGDLIVGLSLSCSLPPGPDSARQVDLAASLGYARVWFSESPALYWDLWIALAHVAARDNEIGLGIAVHVPGLRHVLSTAAAIASLEQITSAGLAVAVGTGFTARRTLGLPPVRWARVERYVRQLRALLRGEEVLVDGHLVALCQLAGWIPDTPLRTDVLVAAMGPVGRSVASRVGVGLMCSGDPPPGLSWCAVMVAGTVLEDGEPPISDRAFAAVEAAISGQYRRALVKGDDVVDDLAGGRAWRRQATRFPSESRHLVLDVGNGVTAASWERPFLDRHLAERTFTGTTDQLAARMGDLETQGATELVYAPMGPDVQRELTAMAGVFERFTQYERGKHARR